MSKSSNNEGFKQRFKEFLGIKKAPASHAIPISIHEGPKSDEYTFTNELLQEIGSDSQYVNRIRMLKDLCDFLVNRKLEDHAVEAAWLAVEDLLQAHQPLDARHTALQFMTVLISGQYQRLNILRAHFFKVLSHHDIPEDLIPRINCLKALSENGKDISYFEEEIGTFLLSWIPEVIQYEKLEVFMPLLINVIHYNSSYLNESTVAGMIREICQIARNNKEAKNIELSLSLLDAVVRYSSLPLSSVNEFISALCTTVNVKNCCQYSWKIMRNVLGTHLGHRGVYTMCTIMESGSQMSPDVMLIRGAVFFIGMCLWGSQRVTTLKHSHSTVLPSMLQGLYCNHGIVCLEVTLSIQRLIKKYGYELHVVSWDSILDITEKLQTQVEQQQQDNATLVENFHILLNYIEELIESSTFKGPQDRFYDIVEKCASKRPESSLLLLVSFRAQAVHPAQANWIINLQVLMEKFFRYEIRTTVRIKALDILSFVLTSYRHWYEEELLDQAVLPFLRNIANDPDVTVRIAVLHLLLDLSQTCDSTKCTDILNIIKDVVSRRVEIPGKGSANLGQENEDEDVLKDIKTAISGLVQVFKVKLFRLPHCHTQQVFSLLVTHLGAHYYNGYNSNIASALRNIIFECFLSMRCDTCHRLGFVNGSEDHEKMSYYYVCTESAVISTSETKLRSLGVIPYSDAFNLILNCLQYEWDWTVLEGVLSSLPSVLQNKTLVLAAEPSLKQMSSVLCKMVSDPATVLDLQKVPRGVGRTGFHALVFPVLTVLATYHFKLGRTHQSELVRSLELGFLSKCANLCVSSLTLCTMEMQPVMNSLLPAILVRLSQISATVSMAVPMLEFLSGLVHLPHLYASFKENQYKSVFAICLPYTDSFRYSQYTVTLAYHVITAWFVRARLPYRKDFVGFIAKGLKTNIIKPERHDSRADSPSIGLRSRSSSSSQSTHSTTRSASPVSPLQLKETDSAHEFHKEMSEVCMDMMARYSFATCFSQPKRTAAMDFLLSKGLTRRWVVGNSVVSITTSGTYIDLDKTCENCLPLQNRPKPDRNASFNSTLSPVRWRERESVMQDATVHKKSEEENTGSASERSKTPEPYDTSCLPAPENQKPYVTDNYEYPVFECHCICQGWAEIKIRRPTGNISWIMRIQNRPEGQMAGCSEGDITTALIDDPHIKEYLLVPDGETEALKIRTKSHEVLSRSKDSEILLIDVIKKDDQSKLSTDPKEAELSVSQPTNDDVVSTVLDDDSKPSQAEETSDDNSHSPKATQSLNKFTPINSPTDDSAESENESFGNRPRLLSNSPRRGPYAFRMTRHSESSENFELKSPPGDLSASAKRRLQYEKPELGVSPAEFDSVLSTSRSDLKTSDKNTYLTSSEMYQIASNDENPKAIGIGGDNKDTAQHCKDGDEVQPKEQPVKMRLKSEAKSKCTRPRSLELLPSEQDPKISHSTLTHTCSNTSGPVTPHRLKDILHKEQKHPSSATSSPRIPVKTKLTKSISLSSPRIIRKNRADAKNTQSLHGIQTCNDQLGQSTFGKVNKSSSSPDLSSPTLSGASKIISGETIKGDVGPRPSMTHVTPSKDSNEGSREPQKFVPMSESYRSPLDPNFVFLQLYHTSFYASSQDKPIPLREGEVLERAIKCLDRIPPYDTHKIGVIYVGPEQHNNETAILRNVYGSTRYMKFIAGLGQLIRLNDSPPDEIYTGGLDREGGDGEFAYSWQDSICQVIFHVATLMPTKDSDPGCNSKKMHIGNDFVTIVYNDSEESVAFGTIKGQFNFAELVIKPLDNECNVVTVRFKEELKNLSVDTGPRVISDINLSMLVRQLAIHINMASVLNQSLKRTTDAYGCNWLERLRQIKRLRGKAEVPVPCSPPASIGKTPQLSPTTMTHPHLLDFTEYVISDKK